MFKKLQTKKICARRGCGGHISKGRTAFAVRPFGVNYLIIAPQSALLDVDVGRLYLLGLRFGHAYCQHAVFVFGLDVGLGYVVAHIVAS